MELYKRGSQGEIVKKIQKVVACYPDGIYGRMTEEAVKSWQQEHGLKADGIVGPATLAKMSINAILPQPSVHQTSHNRYKKSKRKITDIIVHCTATKEGVEYTVEQIRNMHKANGWSDIGYHYIVHLDGRIDNGRDVDISGAHVSGYNSHSIGVVYIGGLENKPGVPYDKLPSKDTRTQAQKDALVSLLIDLKRLYPNAVIKGHRDYSPDKNGNGVIEPWEWLKACPCFDAKEEYKFF